MKTFALAAVSALILSTPALADLGGIPTLPANRTITSATATPGVSVKAAMANPGLYTVRAETQASGTVVREFVATANGEVFAIAWQGPFQPDLRALMGTTFFLRYTQAIQTAHAQGVSMRTQMALTAPDMVIQAHGHVRAFNGLAYVPSLMPAGVSPDQLN